MRNTAQFRRTGEVFASLLLQKAFTEFARSAEEFSRKTSVLARSAVGQDFSTSAQVNLRIARSVFSKWNIEILTLLYIQRALGFQEICKSLGTISTAVLSKKLNVLQERELVKRSVLSTKPPRVSYSLTEKGLTAARLSESLLLYLGFSEGLHPEQTPSRE